MTSPLFDYSLMLERQRRVRPDIGGLPAYVADGLQDRLADIKRDFPVRVDLSVPASINQIEALGFEPKTVPALLSGLYLQQVNDLPGVLWQIRTALQPDGVFIGAVLGGQTLQELREVLAVTETELYGGISPRIHPMLSHYDGAALMQRAGFALPVVDVEPIEMTYPSIAALCHDLRAMGLTNMLTQRSRRPLTKQFWQRAGEIYQQRFPAGPDRIFASFELIWLIGWGPAPTQQQPIPRGSATQSLAAAVKQRES